MEVLADTGHLMNVERPEAVNAKLVGFLEASRAQGGGPGGA